MLITPLGTYAGFVNFTLELTGFGSGVDFTVLDPLGVPVTPQVGFFLRGYGTGWFTYEMRIPADWMKGQYRLTAADRCTGESASAFFEV